MPRVTKVGNAQIVLAVCAVAVAAAAVWWLNKDTDSDDLAENSRNRWFVCTETGKPFRKELEPGMTFPVVSPHSGKPTGVEAELCYWTKDGQPKEDPTPVLLNERAGKSGPTFCPDCGRLVVSRNRLPMAGAKPPPTQAEYAARRGTKSARADAAAR
jgi:hypothetical protein